MRTPGIFMYINRDFQKKVFEDEDRGEKFLSLGLRSFFIEWFHNKKLRYISARRQNTLKKLAVVFEYTGELYLNDDPEVEVPGRRLSDTERFRRMEKIVDRRK